MAERVRASHILVPYKGAQGASSKVRSKKKALAFITGLQEQVVGGADFAALAQEHSSCPSRQKGGDLGEFGRGQMVPPFEQAAFGMEVDAVSDVIETQFGYHVVKRTG